MLTKHLRRISWLGLAGCVGAMSSGARSTGPVRPVSKAELTAPVVIQAAPVKWTRPLASLIGDAPARNTACGTRTTDAPIASFRLSEPIDDLVLEVDQPGGYTQFVVVGPDKFWEQCNGNKLAAPAIAWTPGEYHVYPTGGSEPFTVKLTSPTLAVAPPPAALPTLKAATSGVSSLQLAGGTRALEMVVEVEAPLELEIRVVVDGVERPMRFAQCEVAPSGRCDHVSSVSGYVVTTLPASRRIQITTWQSGDPMPKGTIVVQTIAGRRSVPWYQLVVGEPTATTPLADRDLTKFGVPATRWRPSWSSALAGFTKVPAGLVLYATRDIPGESGGQPRTIAAGEPLIQFEGLWVRANGETVALRYNGPKSDVLSTFVTATRPSAIVMPSPAPADQRSDVSMYHYPYGDDASELAGIDDPRVAAFMKAREPVKACIGRELSKRGSGFGYDIATYDRDGTLKKVESLTKHIEDEVYRVCKVAKLDVSRAKLQMQLRTEALANLKTALETR